MYTYIFEVLSFRSFFFLVYFNVARSSKLQLMKIDVIKVTLHKIKISAKTNFLLLFFKTELFINVAYICIYLKYIICVLLPLKRILVEHLLKWRDLQFKLSRLWTADGFPWVIFISCRTPGRWHSQPRATAILRNFFGNNFQQVWMLDWPRILTIRLLQPPSIAWTGVPVKLILFMTATPKAA